MGAGELPYVAVVVGTSLAALALVTFGLLRRRGSMAWETGSPQAGRSDDAQVDTLIADPTIARRIAELVPPPSGPDDFDASFGSSDDPETVDPSASGEPVDLVPVDLRMLSDGSDESAEDADGAPVAPDPVAWPEAAIASVFGRGEPGEAPTWTDSPDADPAWPVADPGVVRPSLDAIAGAEPAPSIDRDVLSRLLTDAATGLGTAVAWELWVAEEEPRERRYGRPTTIVLAELDGLDAVVAVHGAGVADRAAAMIGTALRANVRTSDRAAVVGPGLYAVLLTETDEIRAVNFVERVRATCEDWLQSNAPGVRIVFGWASPDGDGLAGARARAHQRLLRERG